MTRKSKSTMARISVNLKKTIEDTAEKNNQSLTQASDEIDKLLKKKKGVVIREVKF